MSWLLPSVTAVLAATLYGCPPPTHFVHPPARPKDDHPPVLDVSAIGPSPSYTSCPDCDHTSTDTTFHACDGPVFLFSAATNPGGIRELKADFSGGRAAITNDATRGSDGSVPDRLTLVPLTLLLPPEAPVTFTATNWNNQVSSAKLRFDPVTPKVSLKVDPKSILRGDCATLSWQMICGEKASLTPWPFPGDPPKENEFTGEGIGHVCPPTNTHYVLAGTYTTGAPFQQAADLEVKSCGGRGDRCCTNGRCENGLACGGGSCQPVPPPCNAPGQACCPGERCNRGLVCQSAVCRTPPPPPCKGKVITFLAGQPLAGEGPRPFAGHYPPTGSLNGRLTSLGNPNRYTLLFPKFAQGASTDNCGDPSMVISVAPGGELQGSDLQSVLGSSSPSFPVPITVCVAFSPLVPMLGQVPVSVSYSYTCR